MNAKTESNVLHRNLRHTPREIVSGRGLYLYDRSGNSYLDAVGGAAVNTIGHAVDFVYDEINRRRSALSFTYGARFTNQWQEQLADIIADVSPLKDCKVYFTSGGSEANEIAMKLARQHHIEAGRPSKWKVISRRHSYHGNTLGTLAVSGRPGWRGGFEPYFPESVWVSAPYSYRMDDDVTLERATEMWVDEFEQAILNESPDTVSAFIAEPMIGSSLVGVVPPRGYYEQIHEVCVRHDVLFIADEVLAGCGRTGPYFSIENWEVSPDIITLGKGLGSGYAALGACIVSNNISETIKNGPGGHTQGFTFSGMPYASCVGTVVYDYMNKEQLLPRVPRLGTYLHDGLRSLQGRVSYIGDVRGLGLFGGIEIVQDFESKKPFPEHVKVATRVAQECEDRGIIVSVGNPGGGYEVGDMIQISPAYIIDEHEIDRILETLEDAMNHVTRTL